LAQEPNATYVKLCEPNATYAQRNSRDSTGCHQNSKFKTRQPELGGFRFATSVMICEGQNLTDQKQSVC